MFWELNPKELSPFVKAFALKRKHEDGFAWQQGVYIRLAIASCLVKNAEYPKKPFSTDKETEQTPEQKQDIIKTRFMNHITLLNSRFRKET